jgi:eukaryotic-like serine/threonine-protein kinase
VDTTTRTCQGCNEPFSGEGEQSLCPRCRQLATAGGGDLTRDMDETISYDRGVPPAPVADLARQFAGRTFDAYTVDSLVGRGGMAWVFRARHNWLDRPCAIKILSPELKQRSSDFLDQFIAEARAAASVVHPHIVTVHNIGQTGEHHYIELEFVAGRSLQSILQERKHLPPLLATDLLLQSCAALAAAHRSGLIHRDFKPSNILVADSQHAKLADFGLAKRIVADTLDDDAGDLAGTPPYMAPELFAHRRADPRSDVYAVGVSFYYLLTGTLPFAERNLPKLIRQHAEAEPLDPRRLCPELPDEVVGLIARCLAKRPEERPENGDQLYLALREVYLGLRDIRSLVAEAMAALKLTVQSDGDRQVVNVPLPGGRQQRVFIEDRTAGPWAEHLVKIYSLCCPVREDYFRRALELNADIAFGSLAIEQIDGQAFFVMVNHYPRSTCDAEEIRQSVLDISKWADQVENALTGEDRH